MKDSSPKVQRKPQSLLADKQSVSIISSNNTRSKSSLSKELHAEKENLRLKLFENVIIPSSDKDETTPSIHKDKTVTNFTVDNGGSDSKSFQYFKNTYKVCIYFNKID